MTDKYTVDGEQYDAKISQHKSDGTTWTEDGKSAPLALNEDRQVFYKATMKMNATIANILALGSGNGQGAGITDKAFAGFEIHVQMDSKLEAVADADTTTFTFTCTFLKPTGEILDKNGKSIAANSEDVTQTTSADGKTTTFTVKTSVLPSTFSIPVEWNSGSYTAAQLQEEIVLEVAQAQIKGDDYARICTSGYIDGYIDLTKAGQSENSILGYVLNEAGVEELLL